MSEPTEIFDALAHRFGDALSGEIADHPSASVWETLALHRSCRSYKPDPVGADLIRTLAALALSAPSKSDLQQRDIVIIENAETRARLNALLRSDWIAGAPVLLVFCGNNRRQRQIHDWREKPFANDHLDAFFNAAVDAGIALATFVMAAESIGLGCCPLSAIRNHASEVSGLAVDMSPLYQIEHRAKCRSRRFRVRRSVPPAIDRLLGLSRTIATVSPSLEARCERWTKHQPLASY